MYSSRRRRIVVYYHSTSFLFLLLVSFSRAFNHQTKPQVRFRQHTTKIGASADPLQISDILQQIVSGISPDDEAIVINDVAEAAEDIVVLFEPETIILRLGQVIGKILEIISAYLPGGTLHGDKVALLVPPLSAAVFLFFRSAWPILKAQFVELDELDLAVYQLCFAPVGVKLVQFKAMKATGVFQWHDYEPGLVLIDEKQHDAAALVVEEEDDDVNKRTSAPVDWKYLYWHYSGDVIRSFREKEINTIERTNGIHIDNPNAQGLLGDTRFLYNLEEEGRRQNDSSRNYSMEEQFHPIATITIGSLGARMLRIDCEKLFDLMENDEQLESSIRLLLLKSLKLKVANLLQVMAPESEE